MNKISGLYQSQYPSCNIITIVLQNVTSGETRKHVQWISVLFFATVCESIIVAILFKVS